MPKLNDVYLKRSNKIIFNQILYGNDFEMKMLVQFTRGIARLTNSGGQERNISSFFPILLLFAPIFPHFFLIFFLNLVLWVGDSPTQEDPGYATAIYWLTNPLRASFTCVGLQITPTWLTIY